MYHSLQFSQVKCLDAYMAPQVLSVQGFSRRPFDFTWFPLSLIYFSLLTNAISIDAVYFIIDTIIMSLTLPMTSESKEECF